MISEASFKTQDKLELYTRSHTVENAKADIIFAHGFFEHCARYDNEARFFNKHGYNFYSYDQRSHGKSEGTPRSYITNFQNYVNDHLQFIKMNNSSGRPVFLFSHSMGGLIQVSFILDHLQEVKNFKGALFSSPFLMPDKDLAPMLQKLSGVVGSILPKLKTVKADSSFISRDPAEIKKYDEDPLIYRDGIYAASGKNSLKQIKKVGKRFTEIKVPFIIQHGTNDKLAELGGSRKLIKESSSKDAQLIELKDFKHEITRDLGFENVLKTYLDWMEERL